jgi:hypothetical protein
MSSILEKCYAEQSSFKETEKTLALETYLNVKRLKQRLTKGVLKTITMVYQDMFRVRAVPGKGSQRHQPEDVLAPDLHHRRQGR